MNPVWTPDVEVGENFARRLIASQFPEFAGAPIRRVAERTWRFARYRARHHATMVLNYSSSIGDEALQASARTALRYIET